jgi:hypothetical protein
MIDVEALARECIAEDWDDHVAGWYREMDLNRFAAAVLEEAARVAESYRAQESAAAAHHAGRWHEAFQMHTTRHAVAAELRDAIRALKPS